MAVDRLGPSSAPACVPVSSRRRTLTRAATCHAKDSNQVHANGEGSDDVHQFAWNTFLKATDIASEYGLYGGGQDLLVDAPSGNVRGAGPAVAEIEFDHTLSGVRPAESFMMLAEVNPTQLP